MIGYINIIMWNVRPFCQNINMASELKYQHLQFTTQLNTSQETWTTKSQFVHFSSIFQWTFDTVDHFVLLWKLEYYCGIQGLSLQPFENYLHRWG